MTLRCRLSPEARFGLTCAACWLTLVGLCLTKPTLFIFAPLVLLVPRRSSIEWHARPSAACAGRGLPDWSLVWQDCGTSSCAMDVGAPFPLYGLNAPVTQSRSIVAPSRRLSHGAGEHLLRGNRREQVASRVLLLHRLLPDGQRLCPGRHRDRRNPRLSYAIQLPGGAKRIAGTGDPVAGPAADRLDRRSERCSSRPASTSMAHPWGCRTPRLKVAISSRCAAGSGHHGYPAPTPRPCEVLRWILLGVVIMLVWLDHQSVRCTTIRFKRLGTTTTPARSSD